MTTPSQKDRPHHRLQRRRHRLRHGQGVRQQRLRVLATLRNFSKGGPLSRTQNIEVFLLDRTGGKLDVLVNNAGADYVMRLLDVDIEDAKRFYDLNVWSVLGMVQAFAPMLIKAKGVVVNLSSVASVMPLAWA
ncbi:hypothetical protein N0V85_008760, partial [Neurospora sp. IMI 360204]